MTMAHRSNPLRRPGERRPGERRPGSRRLGIRRPGFTLTELLIVIGLIALVVTLAVPAFRIITGGRNSDAAENQVSAMLGQARQDALGLQEVYGLVFFPDVDNGRVAVAEVYMDPSNPTDQPNRLELVPDRDELVLPVNLGLLPIDTSVTSSATQQNYTPISAVLFDGHGRLYTGEWNIGDPANVAGPGWSGAKTPNRLSARVKPSAPGGTWYRGNGTIGFITFAADAYKAQSDAGNGAQYLKDNSLPFLVNRYNGTLLRSGV